MQYWMSLNTHVVPISYWIWLEESQNQLLTILLVVVRLDENHNKKLESRNQMFYFSGMFF